MSDLIDRQAAIDALMERKIERKPCGINSALEIIKELPSAQPDQWIPCSERLPDIGEHHVSELCIVYCSNGAYGFAELEENIFGQVGWDCERDDEYHEPLGEVLAWMPLPEPYKGETGMNTNVYDPRELVKDLADKIGINQLCSIALDMRGEGTTIDSEKLKMENDELKAHIEYLSRQVECMKGEIKALAYSVRCNGVSGNEVPYE